MRRGNQIVVLDNDVADRSGRHVQPQRLPVAALVERNIHSALGPGKQQSFAHGVFAHGVHRFAIGNSVGNLRPGLARIVSAEDVRPQVIQPQCIDGRVGGWGVEMAGLDDGDLFEGAQLRRRNVHPILSAVGCQVDHAVVGPCPDAVDFQRRGRHRVNHSALRRLRGRLGAVFADACRHFKRLARKVRADL